MATFFVDLDIPEIEKEETTETACLDLEENSNNDVEVDLEENSNNDVEVGVDANSNNDVEVNIAIVGEAGSGRSSFVNAILGTEVCAKTTSKGKEPTSYCHPEYPNIHFSILPSMDTNTFPAFKSFLECVQIENFDAFLLFTAEVFTERHLIFAQQLIKSSSKPFFFIRTKIDQDSDAEQRKKKFNEEKMLTEMKTKLAKKLKDLHCEENEIYLISNHHPEKWDFGKLRKAIAGALPPPQKETFSNNLKKLIATAKFQDYLKEVEELQKDVKKFFPSAAEVKKLFVGSGIVGVQRMMNANLEGWRDVIVNLAVLGESGAGKSSFINALRDVDDGDKNAAETGVTETTKVPTSFPHPTNPNIRFWDLPGIGTPKFPDIQTFLKEVQFHTYNTYLIISSDRFSENDRKLAEQVQSSGKSFFFVRTKIDSSVTAEKRKKKPEEETLEKIRNDCAENLKSFNLDKKKIFLVSSWERGTWDLERLKQEIVNGLPTKQKESFAFSLGSNSKSILEEKIKILKGRVWKVAAASVVSKITLGPFALYVDGKLIKNKVEFYRSQLAFPESGSNEFDKLTNDLKEKVKKFHLERDEDLLNWLKSFDQANTFNIKMYKKMIITKKPFNFVYRLLNQVLDEMKETALDILDKAAKTPTTTKAI